jgi:beta-glucosidase
MAAKQYNFPKNFLWGAATSSHQVEGGNTNNDWWEWEQAGKCEETSGLASDHWNRFREDFKIAKSLHHNTHRFSIEWSRVEPKEGEFDQEAISHYREMVRELRKNGLEPIVTLFHFTLPLWLVRQGGWASAHSTELFTRFAQKMVEVLGGEVRYWMTINEPLVYIFKSYLMGEWPPGERSYEKSYRVVTHFLKGHVAAYDAMKEAARNSGYSEPQIGMAHHVAMFTPCGNSWRDRFTTWLRNLIFNHLFVKALIQGRIFYPGIFRIKLKRRAALDFIGLNYYTRDFVQNKGFGVPGVYGDTCTSKHHKEAGRKNFLSWEIYPQGLGQLVKDFSKYKLPIIISENGICTEHDEERTHFIKEHLRELAKAIEWGAPVFGYLYWSLLDNFEWAEGFAPRFGLVEVDYTTQERKIRPSALEYAEICRSGVLEIEES